MGFFDFLTGGSPEKQVLRQTRRVTNRNAQPEDREAAAYWLADNGSRQAIIGMLGRFDISIENQMKDKKEKEVVFGLLAGLGEAVLEPAQVYVARCKHIAFPMRVILEVGGAEPFLVTALDMLDEEAGKEDYKPDRKRQLLIMLADFQDPRITPSAQRFLSDFDEGVRYAAVEAILAQPTDEGRLALLEALADEEEESNRLRVRVAEAFHARHWSLGEHAERVASNPPNGWRVKGKTLLPA